MIGTHEKEHGDERSRANGWGGGGGGRFERKRQKSTIIRVVRSAYPLGAQKTGRNLSELRLLKEQICTKGISIRKPPRHKDQGSFSREAESSVCIGEITKALGWVRYRQKRKLKGSGESSREKECAFGKPTTQMQVILISRSAAIRPPVMGGRNQKSLLSRERVKSE